MAGVRINVTLDDSRTQAALNKLVAAGGNRPTKTAAERDSEKGERELDKEWSDHARRNWNV